MTITLTSSHAAVLPGAAKSESGRELLRLLVMTPEARNIETAMARDAYGPDVRSSVAHRLLGGTLGRVAWNPDGSARIGLDADRIAALSPTGIHLAALALSPMFDQVLSHNEVIAGRLAHKAKFHHDDGFRELTPLERSTIATALAMRNSGLTVHSSYIPASDLVMVSFVRGPAEAYAELPPLPDPFLIMRGCAQRLADQIGKKRNPFLVPYQEPAETAPAPKNEAKAGAPFAVGGSAVLDELKSASLQWMHKEREEIYLKGSLVPEFKLPSGPGDAPGGAKADAGLSNPPPITINVTSHAEANKLIGARAESVADWYKAVREKGGPMSLTLNVDATDGIRLVAAAEGRALAQLAARNARDKRPTLGPRDAWLEALSFATNEAKACFGQGVADGALAEVFDRLAEIEGAPRSAVVLAANRYALTGEWKVDGAAERTKAGLSALDPHVATLANMEKVAEVRRRQCEAMTGAALPRPSRTVQDAIRQVAERFEIRVKIDSDGKKYLAGIGIAPIDPRTSPRHPDDIGVRELAEQWCAPQKPTEKDITFVSESLANHRHQAKKYVAYRIWVDTDDEGKRMLCSRWDAPKYPHFPHPRNALVRALLKRLGLPHYD